MNTPFVDFKAPEISPEKQKCFFVEPRYIKRVISSNASMIIGERGSGKTTLLKHLEKNFNHSENFEYVGVYYRFETAYVKALNNPEMSVDKNISAFSQSIAAILGKLLCQILDEIKENKDIKYQYEEEICKKLTRDIELPNLENVSSYSQMAEVCERIRKKIFINIQNGKNICYFEYTSFINNFCEELRKESLFSETCFCMLLDEYENLTFSQQRVVNSFIKNSSYYLTYKVCMRPDGFLTKDTVADKEPLMYGHDYEELDYVGDIVGSDKDVKNHLRKICANRLDYFYRQQKIEFEEKDLEIDDYLDIVKEEADIESWERIEEYKEQLKNELKKRYPKKIEILDAFNAIDLKLICVLYQKGYSEDDIFDNICSHTKKYINWIHNYKKNLIFQITSECEQSKKYCGFDTIIKLSHCNTRMILEIMHYAFGELSNVEKVYKKISVKKQTAAVNRVAESSFEQINYIPFNGYKAKNLANALGNLFAEFLEDSRAKKFEVNSFSIIISKMEKEQTEELKTILRDAVIWGVLIPSKANKIKNKGDIVFDGRDYMLHPIFSPYFKISYRKRQKCELKDVDVYSMLQPKSRKELRKELNKISDKLEWRQEELKWS